MLSSVHGGGGHIVFFVFYASTLFGWAQCPVCLCPTHLLRLSVWRGVRGCGGQIEYEGRFSSKIVNFTGRIFPHI